MKTKITLDKIHILTFFKAFLVNLLIFLAIYPTLNSYSADRDLHKLYFLWELEIPIIDWMILPYISMNFFFIVPFLFLETKKIIQLSTACTISTIISGLIFYFYPCQLGFTREIPENFSILYEILFAIDKPFNLFPSLHITYPILFVIFCYRNFNTTSGILIFTWLVLVAVSIFFTHQHHILDIIFGIILALVSYIISKNLNRQTN